MKKKYRIISLILIVCILASGVTIYTTGGFEKIGAMVAQNKNDRRVAEDIASLTGYAASDIMQLRSESGNWNDTIDNLDGINSQKMSNDELAALLEKESFTNEEVSEAQALVMQIRFNLDEILRDDPGANAPQTPTLTSAFDKTEDECEAYKKVGQAFDGNLAVYLGLKLKGKFGSLQAAVDEYLYCLQIGVDLTLCIADAEEYDQKIIEKSAELMREDAITAAKISDYMLSLLQKPKQQTELPDTDKKETDAFDPMSGIPNPNKNTPEYAVTNPKPQDPTQAVMDEIQAINNSWTNRR